MIALLFFMIDLVSFAFFHQWFVQSLLVFFIVRLVRFDRQAAYFSLALLLIQHGFIDERFGLALFYLLPLILLAPRLRNFFLSASLILPSMLLVIIILLQDVLLKKLLFMQDIAILMTIMKIFINLILGWLVLLGTRSNRALLVSASRGRKVWTPNRMNAS
jgi:hypothetical protein